MCVYVCGWGSSYNVLYPPSCLQSRWLTEVLFFDTTPARAAVWLTGYSKHFGVLLYSAPPRWRAFHVVVKQEVFPWRYVRCQPFMWSWKKIKADVSLVVINRDELAFWQFAYCSAAACVWAGWGCWQAAGLHRELCFRVIKWLGWLVPWMCACFHPLCMLHAGLLAVCLKIWVEHIGGERERELFLGRVFWSVWLFLPSAWMLCVLSHSFQS